MPSGEVATDTLEGVKFVPISEHSPVDRNKAVIANTAGHVGERQGLCMYFRFLLCVRVCVCMCTGL